MLLKNKKREMDDSYYSLSFISVCILIKLDEIHTDTTTREVKILKIRVEILDENMKDLKKTKVFTDESLLNDCMITFLGYFFK